jgi:hypothetical protein
MSVNVKAVPRAARAATVQDEADALQSKLNEGNPAGRLVQLIASAQDGSYLLAIFDSN